MGTISRDTTDEELRGYWFDSVSWQTDRDVAKAYLFIETARAVLFRGLRSVDLDGAQTEMRPETVQEMIKQAERFVVANDPSRSRVKHANLQDFRR